MKTTIISVTGVLLLVILSGVITFFFSLEGREQTMVPEVVGKELVEALISLQDDGLVPYVQRRYTQDPSQKGKVVGQKPNPGTLVKAGKQVELVVSRGAIVDRVGSYIGQELTEVKMQLQTLFITSKPLLRIKDPVIYVYSDKPAGTILEQKPEPETQIESLTDIQLVVSRGPEGQKMTIAQYTGLGYREAIQKLAQDNIPFYFTMRPAAGNEKPGVVVKQTPAPGTEAPVGSIVQLETTESETIPRGHVKGLFDYTLPDYIVMVDMKLEAITPTGERKLLFAMNHPGGAISLPYVEPQNTLLVLSIFNREVISHLVTTP